MQQENSTHATANIGDQNTRIVSKLYITVQTCKPTVNINFIYI